MPKFLVPPPPVSPVRGNHRTSLAVHGGIREDEVEGSFLLSFAFVSLFFSPFDLAMRRLSFNDFPLNLCDAT